MEEKASGQRSKHSVFLSREPGHRAQGLRRRHWVGQVLQDPGPSPTNGGIYCNDEESPDSRMRMTQVETRLSHLTECVTLGKCYGLNNVPRKKKVSVVLTPR